MSKNDFGGNMTVKYTFKHVGPGMEVTVACQVQDDLVRRRCEGGKINRGKRGDYALASAEEAKSLRDQSDQTH